MADVAGQPRADLSSAAPDALATGFFELLKRLETRERRFGRSGLPSDEPARLGQRVRMSMAVRDIAALRPAENGRPAEVDVEVLGLLGPEGPMPLHLTRWVMARLSERWFQGESDRATADTAFLDFCNLLQHRMLALYWRAWGDARPEVQEELGTSGRVRALIDALAGVGLPGMRVAADLDLKRRHATSLGLAVHGPERLTRFLTDLVGAPVTLVEFVGHWMDIPAPLQTRIGTSHARLGQSAVAGARTFQRQTRAELRVGPLGLAAYRRLLEDGQLRLRLRAAIRFAVGREIDYDLRLVLARDQVPDPLVGQAQLGRTAWVAPPRRRDADDLRLGAFSADTPGEAAA